jgi:hypothetical protein
MYAAALLRRRLAIDLGGSGFSETGPHLVQLANEHRGTPTPLRRRRRPSGDLAFERVSGMLGIVTAPSRGTANVRFWSSVILLPLRGNDLEVPRYTQRRWADAPNSIHQRDQHGEACVCA